MIVLGIDKDFAARLAITSFFAVEGVLMSTWAVTLPDVENKLNLNDGELGLAVLSTYLCIVLAAPISSFIIRATSASRVTGVGAILSSIALFGTVFSTDLTSLMLTFTAYGLLYGVFDTSMNSAAVIIEFVAQKPIYGSMCALYSVAAVSGSLFVAFLKSYLHWSLLRLYSVMCASILAFSCVMSLFTYNKPTEDTLVHMIEDKEAVTDFEDEERIITSSSRINNNTTSGTTTTTDSSDGNIEEPKKKKKVVVEETKEGMSARSQSLHIPQNTSITDPAMLYLCAIGFLASFGEGVMVTWLVIYIGRYISDSHVLCSMGYTIFYVCQGIGRFACDKLRGHYGRRKLLQLAGGLLSAGMCIVLMSPWARCDSCDGGRDAITAIVIVYFGTAVAGLGVSVLLPTVISSAGQLPGIHPGTAVAAVSFGSNSGSVVGPPLIGGLSLAFNSLRVSLIIDAVLIFFIPILAIFVASEFDGAEGQPHQNRHMEQTPDAEANSTYCDHNDGAAVVGAKTISSSSVIYAPLLNSESY